MVFRFNYIYDFYLWPNHVHGLISDGISQSEGYKMFEQYIVSGSPMDNFDGFELLSRFHAPETGAAFVTF